MTSHEIAFATALAIVSPSIVEARQAFRARFPDAHLPTCNTFSRWAKQFSSELSVNRRPTTAPQRSVTPETFLQISEYAKAHPTSSCREAAKEIGGVSRSYVWKIWHELGLHPFKPLQVQKLKPGDEENRVDFANHLLDRIDNDARFLQNIIWSDEANFYLNGFVNAHNAHYWAVANPCIADPVKTLEKEKITVWLAVSRLEFLEPVFFKNSETVQGANYMQLCLQGVLEPFLNKYDWPFIYMQDGAPAHWKKEVRQWLNEKLPNRWIGRGGPIRWPPRSPDLTLCDFWMWGDLKNRVYRPGAHYESLEQLEGEIRIQINNLQHSSYQRALDNYKSRLQACVDEEGSYFEHKISG